MGEGSSGRLQLSSVRLESNNIFLAFGMSSIAGQRGWVEQGAGLIEPPKLGGWLRACTCTFSMCGSWPGDRAGYGALSQMKVTG